MYFQRSYQILVQVSIGEERKDVFEKDARGGEVGKLSKRAVQSHFETGEFGGAGGSGGGESVRGGGIGDVLRGVER